MTARIVSWDIEATGLKADFAYLLCAGFKVLGEKPKIISIGDYKGKNIFDNEKRLVKDVIAEMNKADVLVSYFGTRYDHPFMNAKALEYGLEFPNPTPRLDLFFTAKSNLAISRKSMQNVAYFSNASHEKSPVEGKIWKAAMAGDRDALAWIEAHNLADIEVLEDVYIKLRPLMRTHPRINGIENCRTCGSSKLQKRGTTVSVLRGPQYRIKCTNCGSWETRALPKNQEQYPMLDAKPA